MSYWFDSASAFSTLEQSTIEAAFSLWAAVANIPFADPYYGTAKYYSSYPVTGTDWGQSSDGTGIVESTTTMMPLDILAVQQLYGAPVGGPLSGNNTFGFNCNISGSIEPFFDFTKNSQPVITLYDSGVDNTFDVSGYAQGATIGPAFRDRSQHPLGRQG